MLAVGRTATRKTMGFPFEIPPFIPPALFVRVVPDLSRMASLYRLPAVFAARNPAPNSRAGRLRTSRAIRVRARLSSRRLGPLHRLELLRGRPRRPRSLPESRASARGFSPRSGQNREILPRPGRSQPAATLEVGSTSLEYFRRRRLHPLRPEFPFLSA